MGAKDIASVAKDFRVEYSTNLRVYVLNSASGFLSELLSIPKAHEVMTSVVYLAIASFTFRGKPVVRCHSKNFQSKDTALPHVAYFGLLLSVPSVTAFPPLNFFHEVMFRGTVRI